MGFEGWREELERLARVNVVEESGFGDTVLDRGEYFSARF